MKTTPVEWPAVIGLLVIGFVAVVSVLRGGEGGLQVASAAVGGIAGWLARAGASRVANVEHADYVQPGKE